MLNEVYDTEEPRRCCDLCSHQVYNIHVETFHLGEYSADSTVEKCP